MRSQGVTGQGENVRFLSFGTHAMRFPSLSSAPARFAVRAASVGALALLLAACAAPFQPSLGPGAPVPGTHGSAPVAANMNCAKAGESFFQRPWQSTAFGGSRMRPDGNYEVILNNADGRRAVCVVNGYGIVLDLIPF